jgi:hypothetical protein
VQEEVHGLDLSEHGEEAYIAEALEQGVIVSPVP